MSRYTENDLNQDILKLNIKLGESKCKTRLRVTPRNGYCAVDIYCAETGKCLTNLSMGSPLTCKGDANEYVLEEITAIPL